MRVKDKVALITGAAHGMGESTARLFAREGAKVVVADILVREGRAVVAAIAADGGEALFQELDVTDEGAWREAMAATVARFGRLDILVNNAGITHACDFLDLAEADFDRVLGVNLKSMFLCGQAVARHMVAHGVRGAVVNLSSVNAVLAIANQVPYTVSKGGVNQLTKVMALALAPHGIRVNGIGPGTIATEMARAAVLGTEEARRRILSRTPLGRLGEPEEVAAIAAFLASDDASYLTGQTIYPDGGRLGLNYTVPVS